MRAGCVRRSRTRFLPRCNTFTTHHVAPLIRLNPDNPNHHLWNNNGTWFIHYVVHPTPFTKDRIRRSLGTKSLAEARVRRDAILGAPLSLAA